MTRRRSHWLRLFALVLPLLAGCYHALPHVPNEHLVETLGVAQARQQLREVISRSLNPQVVDVEVTDDVLYYRYRLLVAGIPTGAVLDNRIHFLNVVTTEIYRNDVILIRTANQVLLAQLVFGNAQDPRTLADLLASFRLHRARNS